MKELIPASGISMNSNYIFRSSHFAWMIHLSILLIFHFLPIEEMDCR